MKTLVVAALLLVSRIAVAQDLTVRRADESTIRLSAADVAKLPSETFEVLDHGRPARFTGVALRELLLLANAGPVDSLRGALLRRVVVAEGADGYRAVIALADMDASNGGRRVYVVNGTPTGPLPAEQGPYRLIIVGDSRAGRWVRQLVKIEVLQLP